MKFNLILILIAFFFGGCFFRNYEGEKIKSPTGNYVINATVNRTNKKAENYATVIIHLYNEYDTKLAEINTGAGDFQKWTIGWTKTGDTIVLQSSDIGDKAWYLKNDHPIELEMTSRFHRRAKYLTSKRYN